MKAINKITKRQKEFLEAIYSSIETEGYPPTFEDLKNKFNISSNQAVIDHLESLENKGLIKREEKSARGIKILPLGYKELGVNTLIPMEGISYTGGFTETMELEGLWESKSKEIQINENLFLIKVSGDSMINAGINDGDMLIAQNQTEFSSGDIILAEANGETTIKRFISEDKPPYLYLKPENPKYENILFTPETNVTMQEVRNFVEGEIYHLYNRGVAKQKIFRIPHDYERLLERFAYYIDLSGKPSISRLNRKELGKILKEKPKNPLVLIINFCLMPNHFHLLAKQLAPGGISLFMKNGLNSYAR